ncbi:amidohydrolase [Desulfonema ishimotonii]|uniref:Amidohydrolase n=1 Tax=Desulfonema ishimotonii TaxID=45657 RepID=A0A401G0Q2_9BACT|nr:amidohydrolase family protein [Desulfonema ishimotonii]GBC62791.1 amidohydrolase [Desulfonema ishimotonii]
MVIDFHTHIFSRAIRDNRSARFPSEPAFKLLYDSPKSRLVGAEDALAMMDEQGVDKSVVFGFPWQDADTFRRENDYILEVVQKYPDRLIGLCCFDALNRAAAAETARCLDAGLSGVGELAFYENGIDEAARNALEPIMAICREKACPILIHTNEPVGHMYPGKSPNTLVQIYKLVKAFPENKIVLAHWGGGIFFYNLLKREAKDVLKNVWYDTAASPFLYDVDIYPTAQQLAGPDKVLFGTDYPLLKPKRYFGDIEKSGVSAADAAAICGGNAAALLNL